MPLDERNISVMNFHYVRHTLDRFLRDVGDLGVNRIELWGAAPHFYTGDRTLAEARAFGKQVRAQGVEIVAFTPEQCIYPINISAREEALRDRSLRYFLECLEFAVELGAPALLVTAGGGYRDESTAQAMARCVDSMGLLCERAQRLGVDLWMESLPDSFANIIRSAGEMRELMDILGSPALYGVYDVAGAVMTNETREDYFDTLGDRLAHVHFTDSDAGGSHLAWGEGIVDLPDLVGYLRAQGYQGSLTVELTNWKYNVDPTPALEKCVTAMRRALGRAA